jgi:hypothetical protein
MTKRHNNVTRIIVQGIESTDKKELVKSNTGQYIHWNQELKLPDEINNQRRDPNFFDREAIKRRLDIWHYTRVKNVKTYELNFNIIEVTILWNVVIINHEKFQKEAGQSYVLAPFKTEDIAESSLKAAREKKIEKYEPIFKEGRSWLDGNKGKSR